MMVYCFIDLCNELVIPLPIYQVSFILDSHLLLSPFLFSAPGNRVFGLLFSSSQEIKRGGWRLLPGDINI
jgi:hypothetical protein